MGSLGWFWDIVLLGHRHLKEAWQRDDVTGFSACHKNMCYKISVGSKQVNSNLELSQTCYMILTQNHMEP